MSKSSSHPVQVVLLFTHSTAILTFFKVSLREELYIVAVEEEAELLEKIKTTQLEAVILDDKLPIALQETLQQIRGISKHIPVIILSSNLKRSYVKELCSCGATEFLREPLEKEFVLETIANAKQAQAIQNKVGPLAQSITQQLPLFTGGVQGEKKLSGVRVSVSDLVLKEIHQALSHQQSISLLMINVDHVDKVRTRWGHAALHELLGKVEQALKTSLRPQDILVNPTLERFVIVLPKTSETAAKIIAENIEEGFANTKFTTQKGTVKLTVSIGIVTLSHKDMDLTDAYTHLEKMLTTGEAYLEKAKKIGKRIVSN